MPERYFGSGKILSIAEYRLIEHSNFEILQEAAEDFNLDIKLYPNGFVFIKALSEHLFTQYIKRIKEINENKIMSDTMKEGWMDNEEEFPLDLHRYSKLNDYLKNDWHEPDPFS